MGKISESMLGVFPRSIVLIKSDFDLKMKHAFYLNKFVFLYITSFKASHAVLCLICCPQPVYHSCLSSGEVNRVFSAGEQFYS